MARPQSCQKRAGGEQVMRNKETIGRIALDILSIFFVVVFLAPVIWALFVSLQHERKTDLPVSSLVYRLLTPSATTLACYQNSSFRSGS